MDTYKNPRTGHTFRVEHVGLDWSIVERDFAGNLFQVMAEYDTEEKAQENLDKLAEHLDWKAQEAKVMAMSKDEFRERLMEDLR